MLFLRFSSYLIFTVRNKIVVRGMKNFCRRINFSQKLISELYQTYFIEYLVTNEIKKTKIKIFWSLNHV